MVAQTPAWGLPYPNDYQQPADSPNALEDLAVAVDTSLTVGLNSVANNAAAKYAQIVPATTWVGDMMVSAYMFGPVTIQPGQEFTIGPFGINPGTFCVCGTQHPSTYLIAVYNDLGNGTAEIRVRNTTAGTVHSNVKVHAFFINPPGA